MTEIYPRKYQYAQIPAGYHPFMAIPLGDAATILYTMLPFKTSPQQSY